MQALAHTIHHHLPLTLDNPCGNRITSIRSQHNNVSVEPLRHQKTSRVTRLAESLSNLLHLQLETHSHTSTSTSTSTNTRDWNFLHQSKQATPISSPKEEIATKWRELHDLSDWENLVDPLHPWLRREVVKYGEFAQATYDAFDFDAHSEYCGSCKYNRHKLFDELGISKNGYKVSKFIYAMSHIELPRWLERSHLMDTWSKDSNWMGYVAVSDDEESRRIGRRDIVVAWRGTVSPSEWYEDLQRKMEPIIGDQDGDVKVEHGFNSIYTSKSESTRYNKTSASEQVMTEVKRLVSLYRQKGEDVSLTITGHSLGGALALLNAYEAATALPDLPISVISFGAPRVGNIAFRDKLHRKGVKILRVVVKQDLVPMMPGIVFNEGLQKFEEITGTLEWVYTHVGAELKLNVHASPYLKQGFNPLGYHCLETYLHLLDGFLSTTSTFRSNARRDVALVNKACGMLVDELRIPECWYQMANKGLVRNSYGRWVKPTRDPEDIPSPSREANNYSFGEMYQSYEEIKPLFSG